VVRAGLVGKVSPPLQQALMFHPDGPAIAYGLASQPDVVARLNQLPPPLMLIELGRLQPVSLQANGTPPQAPPPAAPPAASPPPLAPPLAPLTGRGAAPPESPADWSQAECRATWNSGWRPSPRDFGR
jgi:hypothetical protein